MRVKPKILLFDIETSPNIAYVWGKYEQNVLGDYLQERMIISVAWKWLGEKEVHVMCVPDFYKPSKSKIKNKKLIEKLHSLFVAADIIVAQNGDNFDIKMANTEFAHYGLTPPPPHKTVDTLKVARSKFRFNSNKLDDLGARLGLGRKVKTGGFDLWLGCLRGEKKSWERMKSYNVQDVILLEKIYLKLKPWMTNHPNINVIDGVDGCPGCGSMHLNSRGWQLMPTGRKRRFQCMDCGAWSKGAFQSAGLSIR